MNEVPAGYVPIEEGLDVAFSDFILLAMKKYGSNPVMSFHDESPTVTCSWEFQGETIQGHGDYWGTAMLQCALAAAHKSIELRRAKK